MRQFFVNLKRFDVSRKHGGLCPAQKPTQWVRSIIDSTVECGLGAQAPACLTFLLPEGLLAAAVARRAKHPAHMTRHLRLGVQGVYREDVEQDGNFGAFTTLAPAAASAGLGAEWVIVGHSEERRDKLGVISTYDSQIASDPASMLRANETIDALVNAEAQCALRRGISVLLCVGETLADRGEGSFADQQPRIESVLRRQLELGLRGAGKFLSDKVSIVVGYEPVWAIGPGKTPPSAEYIEFVAAFIKQTVLEIYDMDLPVIYGGGLKEENAASIAALKSLSGGLVGLTRFTPPIAFEVEGLRRILQVYLNAVKDSD